jgi:hypothetical protein
LLYENKPRDDKVEKLFKDTTRWINEKIGGEFRGFEGVMDKSEYEKAA